MEAHELDAIIGTSWDSVRYLTGSDPNIIVDSYTDMAAAILPLDGEPAIVGGIDGAIGPGIKILHEFSSFPYTPNAIIPRTWARVFRRTLRQVGVRRGRVGFDLLPDAILRELRDSPSIEFVPILRELLECRAVKTSEEIGVMRQAASIVDEGMQRGLDFLKEGVTEREVFAEMSGAMFRAGSEILPWTPCTTCGGVYIDLKPTNYKLRRGDSIRWDIGAMFRGYYGDASRTAYLGKPDREFTTLYQDLYEAYMSGVKAIRPGKKASDVDFAVRETLRQGKYPIYNMSMGHGLGMKVLELPWIAEKKVSRELDMTLESGMVISLEPETYANGKFARLEDMILVTEGGNELLTKTPYLSELL